MVYKMRCAVSVCIKYVRECWCFAESSTLWKSKMSYNFVTNWL